MLYAQPELRILGMINIANIRILAFATYDNICCLVGIVLSKPRPASTLIWGLKLYFLRQYLLYNVYLTKIM